VSRRDGGQPRGQVDADDAGAPLGEVARDAPLPAGQVAHAQAGHVAESKEEQHVIESKGTMAATEVVDRYFAIWNEADPARRRALIEATWSPGRVHLEQHPRRVLPGVALDDLHGLVAAGLGHERRPARQALGDV